MLFLGKANRVEVASSSLGLITFVFDILTFGLRKTLIS